MLFITRKWAPAVGGMETYSGELVRELGGLVSLTVRALPGRDDGRPPSGIRLGAFLLQTVKYLWATRQHFDVVHVGDFVLFPLAWVHAKMAPEKVRVLTVHGLDLVYGNRRGLRPALYRWFVGWARKRRFVVSQFIANSRNTARLARDQGFTRVCTVPLGVRMRDEETEARYFLPVKDRVVEPYVLFVGRLVRRKGAAWFAQHVLPRLPHEVQFYVVGSVWDAEEASALSGEPRVHMLGFVSEKRLRWMRANARAVVMPNLPSAGNTDVEGFGLAALEAVADGGVVIAAGLEGVTDAIQDGENGFLVESGDAELWAARIRWLLQWDEAERAAFVARTRERLHARYAWSRVARDTVAVYSQCLADRDALSVQSV